MGRWRRNCKPGVRLSHTQCLVNTAAVVWGLETSARQGTTACSGPKRPVREITPGLVSPFPAMLPSHWLGSVKCSKQVYTGPCKIKYYSFKNRKSSRDKAWEDGTEHGKHGCGSVDTSRHHNASHPHISFLFCRHWFLPKHPRLCWRNL